MGCGLTPEREQHLRQPRVHQIWILINTWKTGQRDHALQHPHQKRGNLNFRAGGEEGGVEYSKTTMETGVWRVGFHSGRGHGLAVPLIKLT